MDYLKKRSVAMVIAAVVIVFGTLLGVHLSVGRASKNVEALFYSGVNDTYPQPSIASQLDKRVTASLGLLTVADNYGDLSSQAKDLRNARAALQDAKTVGDKFTANAKLESAYEAVRDGLTKESLKDNEKASTSTYITQMDGAQSVIDGSGYNARVGDFISNTLGAFPVNILKNFAFVSYPEYFGTER